MPVEHESRQTLGPPCEDELARRQRFLRGEPEPERLQAKVLEAAERTTPQGVQGVQTK